jgi:hypothetical protein
MRELTSTLPPSQETPGPRNMKTIPQGAATSVWAGVTATAEAVGGRYCEDCHVAEAAEGPGLRARVQPYAVDAERARRFG